jgi:hypothetical protein
MYIYIYIYIYIFVVVEATPWIGCGRPPPFGWHEDSSATSVWSNVGGRSHSKSLGLALDTPIWPWVAQPPPFGRLGGSQPSPNASWGDSGHLQFIYLFIFKVVFLKKKIDFFRDKLFFLGIFSKELAILQIFKT